MRLLFILSLAMLLPAFVSGAMAQPYPPIKNSYVAVGQKQIARAWLSEPTTRYQHFVLGDRFEASRLVVQLANGQQFSHELPASFVFEDRHVRLADLNNDGADELVVVMSSISLGAALAVFNADQSGLHLLATTPHIGLPYRWLNPAGIADFDGDGNLEIALVQKPHLTKRLEFWRLDGERLVRVGSANGFSNHRNGSRNQRMSAAYDINNDGVVDLLIPSANRTEIIAVTLVPEIKQLRRWQLPSPADGDFELQVDKAPHQVVLKLESGDNFVIALQ
ncbi:FG-GAP repeat domain-containing protein [Maritalea porphyrae]|uniref:VCBS repeat-containing protein n=1 Tax=Maritalea porphyrae TaxID=880732 RepID=A0ABQ5UR25_9HYPH|nr:VCBS repeat-containing protein [Maritalea porphyrae]GLQ17653.1 hypothetical protein GCM10007879_19020 [Maritalea porphyrae]